MLCMTVSRAGEFRLGASYGKMRHLEARIWDVMRELTRVEPEYGTSRLGGGRTDICRCTINTSSSQEALDVFLNFYNELKDEIDFESSY